MRSLFRANWRCLYPRAGGGGHPEAHPLLSYTFRNDVLLFYALAAGLSPLLLPPLTFELNIPSSPWTGIFYTSPNVVFVYVSRVPRGTRVYGLCYGVSSFEEGEVNSFWRMSLVFFFFFLFQYGTTSFWKILIFRIFKLDYIFARGRRRYERINSTSGFDTRDVFGVQTGSAMLGVQSLETRVRIMGAGNTVGTNYHREKVVFYDPCTGVYV